MCFFARSCRLGALGVLGLGVHLLLGVRGIRSLGFGSFAACCCGLGALRGKGFGGFVIFVLALGRLGL